MFFNVFYKSEKNMFFMFFYLQINVFNIYGKNQRIVFSHVLYKFPVSSLQCHDLLHKKIPVSWYKRT